MPTSPEQIQQILDKAGYKPTQSGGSSVPQNTNQASVDARINSWSQPAQQNQSQPGSSSLEPNFSSRVKTDLTSRIGSIDTTNKQTQTGKINPLSGTLQTVGHVGGAISDVGSELFKSLYNVLPKNVKENASSVYQKSDIPKLLASPQAQKVGQALNQFAEKHPEASQDLKSVLDILGGVATIEGGKGLVSGAQTLGKAAMEKAPQVLASAGEKTGSIVGGIKGGTKEVLGRTTGKSLDDILATSEKDVSKLNPADQKTWNDANRAKIAEPFNTKEQQLKMAEDARKSVHVQDLKQMNKDLATATRDEVIANRPKGLSMMRDASDQFRSIFNEEVAGKTGVKVDTNQIGKFIESHFGDDPAQVSRLKSRLGISENIDPNAPKTETTLGQILNRMKGLKQEVGSAAKSGSRTFSADEKLTTDAAGTLSEYLKTQGIDLSRSNKFWSKYKPIQKQYISLAKPFNTVKTETKGFANVLKNTALGKDVNNENFISHIERMQGKPINVKGRSIVAKMTAAEKVDTAAKIQHEISLAENAAKKESALKSLDSAEHARLRTAKIKQAVKKAIGFIVADKLAKHTIGIGF